MKRRTLGLLLLAWSVLTIANSAVSIQLDIFPPTPPGGHPESALRVLQAMPFPWLWYFILGPACLIACAVLVAAGGARMAIRPNSHPWLAMLGLVLALGTVLTTLVTELASRRAPFNFPWQWAVTQASAAVVVGVGLYLVAAAPRDNLPPSLSSQARDLLKAAP
jgi:amino acid transporter